MPTTLEPQDCSDDLCDQKSALLEKANACILQGKIALARTLMLESQKLAWDPRVAQMLEQLATVRYNLPASSLEELLEARFQCEIGNVQPALQRLASLAEEHPHSPLVQREWGRRLLDAGDGKEACRILTRVATLEPHSVSAQLEALVCFLACGQWEMAEMYAVRALRIDSQHPEANLWMARLQARLEPLAACQYAEQFLQVADSTHPAWVEAWELLDNGLPVEIREALR